MINGQCTGHIAFHDSVLPKLCVCVKRPPIAEEYVSAICITYRERTMYYRECAHIREAEILKLGSISHGASTVLEILLKASSFYSLPKGGRGVCASILLTLREGVLVEHVKVYAFCVFLFKTFYFST